MHTSKLLFVLILTLINVCLGLNKSIDHPEDRFETQCVTKQGLPGICKSKAFCTTFGSGKSFQCSDSFVCCTFAGASSNIEKECGQRPDIEAIVGGFESAPNTWPWAVAIYERRSSSGVPHFMCGGSVIDEYHILSAAHCFVRYDGVLSANKILIKAATHSLTSNKYFQEVQKVIAHQKYNPNRRHNDIALIRLKKPLEFNPTLAPICLPPPKFKNYDLTNKLATVIGWGALTFGSQTSDTLQEVEVPIVNTKDCKAKYATQIGDIISLPFFGASDYFICAGYPEGGKDSCQGDSGGPLAIKFNGKWTLIGIVSFGYKCAEPDYPGVYTRVTTYLDWIGRNIIN